jgi:hypothetical protein
VARANAQQHRHPCRLPCGTSRVSRGTVADRLAIRIWDSADLLAHQRPLSARPRRWRRLRRRTGIHPTEPVPTDSANGRYGA